ncbi:MAG: enoyl-CoA hydratase/isomerase family protein [Bacteroidota bacterium]
MEKQISFETELSEGILTITINHSKAYNPLGTAAIDTLRVLIQEVYDNNEIKSVVITGSGEDAFATGAAPKEIQALNELNGRKFAEHGQETFALIENCHKPIVAAINGAAHGGGFSLALACHFRIASEHATFSFPEVSMGTIPSFGGTQRLTHLIGKTKALELMMTGRSLTAIEAQALGIVNYIENSKDALIQKSKALLQEIMAQAPLAIGMIINCTNAAYNPHENGYQTEANSFAHCCKTDDLKEGIAALLEKRTPVFKGT